MNSVDNVESELKKQFQASINSIDEEFSKFLKKERENAVPQPEIIQEESDKFLHNAKASINDEFSKEVFAFLETPETTWTVNPVFFEDNRELDKLMTRDLPELTCPSMKLRRLPRGPLFSNSPSFLARNAYRLLYAIIPILGLVILFFSLWSEDSRIALSEFRLLILFFAIWGGRIVIISLLLRYLKF